MRNRLPTRAAQKRAHSLPSLHSLPSFPAAYRAATVRKRLPLVAYFAIAGGLLGAELSPTEYLDYIKYLASDQLKGRATGSPELEKAATYIAKQFKAWHL